MRSCHGAVQRKLCLESAGRARFSSLNPVRKTRWETQARTFPRRPRSRFFETFPQELRVQDLADLPDLTEPERKEGFIRAKGG